MQQATVKRTGFYLLVSRCGKYSYIGATNDIDNRVDAHNAASFHRNGKGARFTTDHAPGQWVMRRFWPTDNCGDTPR